MSTKFVKRYIIFIAVVTITALFLCLPQNRAKPVESRELSDYASMLEKDEIGVFKTQAIPSMEAGVGNSFRTDFAATVIIAVDKSQYANNDISGWSSIRYKNFPVAMPESIENAVMAISSGMDYKENETTETMLLLRYLFVNNRLVIRNYETAFKYAPVAVMYDFQAAKLMKNGMDIRPIIPIEGTVSFEVGALAVGSNNGRVLGDDLKKKLIAEGYRLKDGTCDRRLYQRTRNYDNVKNIDDIYAFNETKYNTQKGFIRNVKNTHIISPVGVYEQVTTYILGSVIIIVWTFSAYSRITNANLKKILIILPGVQIIWFMSTLVKFLGINETLTRYLWYVHYSFMVIIPLILFYMTLMTAKSDLSKKLKFLKIAVSAVSGIIIALIVTNNFHNLLFSSGFDLNLWHEDYVNEIMHYVVFAWSICLIVVFTVTGLYITREKSIRVYTYFIVPAIISSFYLTAYATQLPILSETDIVVFYASLIILVIEIYMLLGFISNSVNYMNFFADASIQLQIFDNDMNCRYKTKGSSALQNDVIREYIRDHDKFNEADFVRVPQVGDESTVYDVYKVKGGFAVYAESIYEVMRLRCDLLEKNKRLKEENAILVKNREVKSQLEKVKFQRQLLADIETVLFQKTEAIKSIFDTIPAGDSVEEKSERIKKLNTIKLLVYYCKRRSNLLILDKNNQYLSIADIDIILNEALNEAKKSGIDSVAFVMLKSDISAKNAVLIYEFVFFVIEEFSNCKDAAVMFTLKESEEKLDVVVTVESSREIFDENAIYSHYGPSYYFANECDFSVESDEDAVRLSLRIKKGEQTNA